MSTHAEVSRVARAESSSFAEEKLDLARELYASARHHKQQAEHHRRYARNAMARFERFKKDLERMGIEVVIESHQSRGGTSDRST